MSILDKHAILEKNTSLLFLGSLLVVTIGGIVEIAPLFYLENTIEEVEGVRPYTPLELAGRSMDALRDTLKARNQAHAAAQQAEPAPRPAPEPPPEPTPEAASSSPADAATKPDASSDLINPMRWWDTLTQQFTHLAAQAAQPMGAASPAKAKPAVARKTAGTGRSTRPSTAKRKPSTTTTARARKAKPTP